MIGKRVCYIDLNGRIHDAGVVTKYVIVNGGVTVTTQLHPDVSPLRWPYMSLEEFRVFARFEDPDADANIIRSEN